MGKGQAFNSCSRAQLLLIFGNTIAFFVAGTLLGYGIYVFSYMRTTNTAVVIVCIGASVGVMIATAMGAWGALLKKHGVLKVYFYTVLLLDIVLLVTGTLCYVRAAEVSDYVDYEFQTVKGAMPDSECDFVTTTAGGIAACKSNMKETLQDNLRYMGACCIVMAVMMLFGIIAAARLLTWDRLTGPLLHGGGVVMILFAIFNLSLAVDMILNEQDALQEDVWATYVAAGSAAVVIILALLGITGMRYSDPMSASRAACLLLGYQVVGFITVILLGYLAVLAYVQCGDITSWTTDNFDTGNKIRSNLNDNCYCNNDDYTTACGSGNNPYCNEKYANGTLKYYICSGGTCTVDSSNAYALQYCLTTSLCVDKAVDSAQGSLAAIGTMSAFYTVYLLVCMLASLNVRRKLVETVEHGVEDRLRGESPKTIV